MLLILLLILIIVIVLCDDNINIISNTATTTTTTTTTTSSTTTTNDLIVSFDNIIPLTLIEKLIGECTTIASFSLNRENYLHGKSQTYWYDITNNNNTTNNNDNTKLLTLEKVILLLSNYLNNTIITSNDRLRPKKPIIGAEFWVQSRSQTENINFHYDKDESIASNKHYLVHPILSTVLYLTDEGSPTVILNQTSPDGNIEIPIVPQQGYFIYPKKNRYMIFAGDLQHGVCGTCNYYLMNDKKRKNDKKRITLLVNWWDQKPEEPNTRPLRNGEMKIIANKNYVNTLNKKVETEVFNDELLTIQEQERDKLSKEIITTLTSINNMYIPIINDRNNLDHNIKSHILELPPGDFFNFYIMSNISKHGAYYVQWNDNQMNGPIGILNLFNKNQVNAMFRLIQPKILLLYDHTDVDLFNAFSFVIYPLVISLLLILLTLFD